MTESEAKLVRMAGEIRQFFRHQGDASYGAAANHIRQFWAPSMRRDFLALADRPDSGLDPEIAKVAAALRADE